MLRKILIPLLLVLCLCTGAARAQQGGPAGCDGPEGPTMPSDGMSPQTFMRLQQEFPKQLEAFYRAMMARADKGDRHAEECLCQPHFFPLGLMTQAQKTNWCLQAAASGSAWALQAVSSDPQATKDPKVVEKIQALTASAAAAPANVVKVLHAFFSGPRTDKTEDLTHDDMQIGTLSDLLTHNNSPEVIAEFEHAADGGLWIAQIALGEYLKTEKPAEAEKWLLIAAKNSDELSVGEVSDLYEKDMKDYAKAAAWQKSLLTQKEYADRARCELGYLYETGGPGLQPDHAQALDYWGLKGVDVEALEAGAEKGDAEAALRLAKLYPRAGAGLHRLFPLCGPDGARPPRQRQEVVAGGGQRGKRGSPVPARRRGAAFNQAQPGLADGAAK